MEYMKELMLIKRCKEALKQIGQEQVGDPSLQDLIETLIFNCEETQRLREERTQYWPLLNDMKGFYKNKQELERKIRELDSLIYARSADSEVVRKAERFDIILKELANCPELVLTIMREFD